MKATSILTFLASTVSHTTYPYQRRHRIPDHFRSGRLRLCRCKTLLAALWCLSATTSSTILRYAESFSAFSTLALARRKFTPLLRTTRSSKRMAVPTETNPVDEPPDVQTPWKCFPSWQYNQLVEKHGVDKVKLIYMVRHAEGTHNVDRNFHSVEQIDARLTQHGIEQCIGLRDQLLLVKDGVLEDKANNDPHRQGLEYLMGNTGEFRDNDDETNKGSDICVVVSPLTRCIQTAINSFEFFAPTASPTPGSPNDSTKDEIGVPFVGLEALRETVNYNCDRRRSISEVAKEFPQIDFSFCTADEDEVWLSYRKKENDPQNERVLVGKNNNNNVPDDDDDTNVVPVQSARKRYDYYYLESAQLYAVADRGRQAMNFIESLPQSRVVVCTHSAYLRCILNWGQTGGVPRMFDQRLDDREDPTRQDKLFEYCVEENEEGAETSTGDDDDDDDPPRPELDRSSFEEYMRTDYENAELRSFCFLAQQT